MAKLTPKQERFVEEYLVDLCATQAAIRAGYSVKTAHVIGHENLNKPKISMRVQERLAEISKRTGINQERVLRELARIAFANPVEIVNMDTATILDTASEDDTAAIASVKVKISSSATGDTEEREIRFWDKNKALELLGKYFSLWVDRNQVDVSSMVQIVDDIPKSAEPTATADAK